MQLCKRKNLRSAFDESKFEVYSEMLPAKQINCWKANTAMDVEIDFDEKSFLEIYAGDSRGQLGFFDLQTEKNKYTPNLIWSDQPLVISFQRLALLNMAKKSLENLGMSKQEAKKKLRDPEFLEQVHRYFIYLNTRRRILPE